MSVSVARRYKFHASHEAVGLPPPWCERHEHDYTVEVVYTAEVDELISDTVIDTDEIDAAWREIAHRFEGQYLNNTVGGSTTVEQLAQALWVYFLGDTSDNRSEPASVTVWEDDDRWGRFEP
jgi:6-pyruvoyl-tetrahydropterin synthase